MSRINPEELELVLNKWLQQLMGSRFGKSLRGSYDREKGIKALNLVTAKAWEQQSILGQVQVESKSNEITAIPALKQKRAAMNNDYMISILSSFCQA